MFFFLFCLKKLTLMMCSPAVVIDQSDAADAAFKCRMKPVVSFVVGSSVRSESVANIVTALTAISPCFSEVLFSRFSYHT